MLCGDKNRRTCTRFVIVVVVVVCRRCLLVCFPVGMFPLLFAPRHPSPPHALFCLICRPFCFVPLRVLFWLDWNGLDWIGLGWVGLDWRTPHVSRPARRTGRTSSPSPSHLILPVSCRQSLSDDVFPPWPHQRSGESAGVAYVCSRPSASRAPFAVTAVLKLMCVVGNEAVFER